MTFPGGRWRAARSAAASRTRTEPALLANVGRGDQDALFELYRRHGPLVYAVARRVIGPQRAEAVTCEVFLGLWARPTTFSPGEESLRSFLLAQAHADAVDLLSRTPGRTVDAEKEDPALPLLEAIPTAEASALALIVFGGCTFREAAILLDEPEADVRRRAVDGLQALSTALGLRRADVAPLSSADE